MTKYIELSSIDNIVIHCSATQPEADVGVTEIRQWHLKRGFTDVGYHYVIRRDGTVETGRPDRVMGAHARGHNHNSIAICLVGGVDSRLRPVNNFTSSQFRSLKNLVRTLMKEHPDAAVIGHRDLHGVKKACPSFDVADWKEQEGLVRDAEKHSA